ncbi:hypothetical protein LTR37_010676 [Vermiconidia calcicola]|uniref:Uncharacterized protein n=1 Tax=Vermiconidia calcicola TaxID=1690605 RepID=A0ACC3N4C9_9PEZI|nr:hypothetical protein LTR37_010676 [Vermiconidia calcicola]
MAQIPESVANVVADGDAILVLSGFSGSPQTPIGLRVSTHALSLASPTFKNTFANAKPLTDTEGEATPPIIVDLLDEDADAMYILVNILHLRNDKLPTHLPPSGLRRLAILAQKYACVVAASRATVHWFDRLYFNTTTSSGPIETWSIIEAAYLFDEATFFARFTTAWILKQSLHTKQIPLATTAETQKLALMLAERQSQAQILLRRDIDMLADACAFTFSKDKIHYIDYAPGLSPDPDEGRQAVTCPVDSEGAKEYLGALRDAKIWPSVVWEDHSLSSSNGGRKDITIGDMVDRIKAFREPEYDDCDKCEFCEDVRLTFVETLQGKREEQEKRLWGLCLDCFKAGVARAGGECRVEHA